MAGTPSSSVSSGSAAADLAYVEATADLTITATTSAGADLVISSGAIAYSGVPIWIEFFAYGIFVDTGACVIELRDNATVLSRWGDFRSSSGSGDAACFLRRRLTPSAGSHTYLVRAFKSGTTAQIQAGDGTSGAGVGPPMYIRTYAA